MSGSYNDMDGPPTLVSFAIAPCDARRVISPDFKEAGHEVVVFDPGEDLTSMRKTWESVHELIKRGIVVSAWAVTAGGAAEGVLKMTFGNEVGFECLADFLHEGFFACSPGAIVAEVTCNVPGASIIGRTIAEPEIRLGAETQSIADLKQKWEGVLEGVFPTRTGAAGAVPKLLSETRPLPRTPHLIKESRETPGALNQNIVFAGEKFAKPRALIIACPGTNGELDATRALERAGGVPEIIVVRNLTAEMLGQSIAETARAIRESQILILPGGPSAGSEPDGSAKFLGLLIRSAAVSDAVHEHLASRDGLILGISDGFHALVRLGLVPFGRIIPPDAARPALTLNLIGRHQAKYVYTRIASVSSPWMSKSRTGDIHAVAVSHSEGRFNAPQGLLGELIADGRIATQYTDPGGKPSMDTDVNPSGSLLAVEGVFSPGGRVFGKMGHPERYGELTAINIYGEKHQPVFESGVHYFI
jgi:phosphoribosylformylglycinamidine synthase